MKTSKKRRKKDRQRCLGRSFQEEQELAILRTYDHLQVCCLPLQQEMCMTKLQVHLKVHAYQQHQDDKERQWKAGRQPRKIDRRSCHFYLSRAHVLSVQQVDQQHLP